MNLVEKIDAFLGEEVDYSKMSDTRLHKLLNDYKMKKAGATTENKKLQFQNQISIIQSVLNDRK